MAPTITHTAQHGKRATVFMNHDGNNDSTPFTVFTPIMGHAVKLIGIELSPANDVAFKLYDGDTKIVERTITAGSSYEFTDEYINTRKGKPLKMSADAAIGDLTFVVEYF